MLVVLMQTRDFDCALTSRIMVVTSCYGYRTEKSSVLDPIYGVVSISACIFDHARAVKMRHTPNHRRSTALVHASSMFASFGTPFSFSFSFSS